MKTSQIVILTWFLAGCVHAIGTRPTFAQIVPLKNGGFEFVGPAIHAMQREPDGWTLEEGKPDRVRVWNAPGSNAVALGNRSILSQTFILTPVPEPLQLHSAWVPVVMVDVIGEFGNATTPAELEVAIRDSQGQVVQSQKMQIQGKAPQSKQVRTQIAASSFQPGSGPENAFDENPQTIWHSKWGDKTHPHWLLVDFGEVRKLRGFSYTPRQDLGNGTIGQFRLEVTNDGETWRSAAQGVLQSSAQQPTQTMKLDKVVSCRAVRLIAEGKRAGAGDINASCAEWTLDVVGGLKLNSDLQPELAAVAQRMIVPLSSLRREAKATSTDQGPHLKIQLRVHGNNFAVLDQLHVIWVPELATMQMQGKANGVSGPDVLAAGSYGFKGLMIHGYPSLPVVDVQENSPVARAGLKKGDLILSLNGIPLPPGNVEPGPAWFSNGHEVLFGQAALAAYGSGSNEKGAVKLTAWRNGKTFELTTTLNLPSVIADETLLTDPNRLAIVNTELIQHVVQHQLANGSWENNPIKTALGGLALLSTGDSKHAKAIKSAANWLMERNAEPDTGFYWFPSIGGIFLAEYYLATGDARTLPVMERMLKHMNMAYHTSAFGTETFGHGPRGLPYGNKSLVAVMVHTFVFESLAHRCGIKSDIFGRLKPYVDSAWSDPAEGGHGALGYNASHKDLEEFWSRSGLLTLALQLRNERPEMRRAMTTVMRQRHPWIRNSHAYGEPGGAWGLIGLLAENKTAFQEVFAQYRWWFAVALEPGYGLRYTPPHMGAPYMEGDVLINNCYALVTNLHKQNLHISGSSQKSWLDVSAIPVPLSEVLILQDAAGLVSLRSRIPGSEIYFTTDGSQPNNNSRRFHEPFAIAEGSVVKAVAINDNDQSKIAERSFALSKELWKIELASGHQDAQLARQRAALAIDGDPLIAWVTDGGEAASGFPHELVIDIGAEQQVSQVEVRFLTAELAAKRVTVFEIDHRGASDNDGRVIGRYQSERPETLVRIALDESDPMRKIGFRFEEPHGESILMVGEIDLHR
ncbi:MAG: discoidin domain-containing protein [Planctomycetaceae bacterium]|nr:discoidin domain-containing protein [Planctomycetaceae bacterium]